MLRDFKLLIAHEKQYISEWERQVRHPHFNLSSRNEVLPPPPFPFSRQLWYNV